MKCIINLLVIVFFTSCTKSYHQNNEITKVELAKVTAIYNYGTAIHIDSSLIYIYYGKLNTNKEGYYKSKISISFWDSLNNKFKRINYKTLDTADKTITVDGEYYELIIHWKNGRRRITRFISYQSDSLLTVLNWLDTSYKKLKLNTSKAKFKFETTYQNPPPMPKIDRIKFPPPMFPPSIKQ